MDTINANNLIWDTFNTDHIRKHSVSMQEIVEACGHIVHTEKTKKDRFLMVGITDKKRILSMVLANKDENQFYLVTARDASKKERKIYAQKHKKHNS
jgi:uncharacterized DUF497 family protein